MIVGKHDKKEDKSGPFFYTSVMALAGEHGTMALTNEDGTKILDTGGSWMESEKHSRAQVQWTQSFNGKIIMYHLSGGWHWWGNEMELQNGLTWQLVLNAGGLWNLIFCKFKWSWCPMKRWNWYEVTAKWKLRLSEIIQEMVHIFERPV